MLFVEKVSAGDGGLHLICRSSAAAADTDPNISKDGSHGECMLIFLHTNRNITPKYDTNVLIIRRHYK